MHKILLITFKTINIVYMYRFLTDKYPVYFGY